MFGRKKEEKDLKNISGKEERRGKRWIRIRKASLKRVETVEEKGERRLVE